MGQRARIGGGTDGSARIGSAILYGVRAVTAWNLKPMGHCSIANGSAATAWPGLARTHAHDPTIAQAQAHTHAHAGQRCWPQCQWGVRPGSYAQTREAFGLPGGHECDAALAPNQSAGVVDELDGPLPRLPRDACSTPRHVQRRARIGSGRSPRSEPGATRRATRAADPSSCRRRSRQCERRSSRCSAPQRPPQPAGATTRGSANHRQNRPTLACLTPQCGHSI